ncbi:MAG: NAD kinase [Cyclobacteriaceae bacterium]
MKSQQPIKIAIHGNISSQDFLPHLQEILHILRKKDVEILLSEKLVKQLTKCKFDTSHTSIYRNNADLRNARALLSVGGDGTILESVTHVGAAEVPILGINTGRLGFLATTPKDKLKNALTNILEGNYEVESRMLVQVDTEAQVFKDLNFGLNEFAILKQDTSSMVTVHAYLDGELINSYWADGLIIATPTGSTGYSLSCGGPIVSPYADNFIITPVSPHNLSIRPLVVPATSSIRLEVEARTNFYLVSLDSRSCIVPSNYSFTLKKSAFKVQLIKFSGHTFVETLRMKLNWGYDIRN